jgi:hypothetical protein
MAQSAEAAYFGALESDHLTNIQKPRAKRWNGMNGMGSIRLTQYSSTLLSDLCRIRHVLVYSCIHVNELAYIE